MLSTAADIVADPSAPDAFVQGIMEGKEWVWNNGILAEKTIESYQRSLSSCATTELTERKLQVFESFLRNIKIS